MYSNKNQIIFKITHIISFLIGLAPYSIRISSYSSKKPEFNFTITYSRLGCTYNILLMFVFVGMTLIVTPRLIAWQYGDHSVLSIIVAIQTMIGSIASIIVILHYTLHQKQSVTIGNKFSEFDATYGNKFLRAFDESNSNRLKNLRHWLTIFLFTFIWSGVVSTSVGDEQSPACIASFLNVIVLSSVLIQYSSVVDNLRGRFKRLNAVLPKIFKCPIPSLPFAENVWNNRFVTNDFVAFRQARNELYRISCLTSEFYSFPILLTIFYSCCATINTAYYFLLNVVQVDQFILHHHGLNILFWFFICVYPTIALSRSVHIFNIEMHKTADIVYDILDTSASNREVEYQLNNFALEVKHKKVEFTACGFFSLDCTLLQSMFGAFVTYLLIMLQFKPKDVMQD
ncbi:putative gustatory receptor 28a [Diachasma alloeum]|uniref:Gustatory receptor n=1 Tax=Diachasma alloeum TaxID=454923 RepID=A0A4E0RSG5_9HYME|nr:putative gustatory receptor 28a [Diachasma alloeum]THK32867.1 gustatory receptor 30 [Diachasma alloeum]